MIQVLCFLTICFCICIHLKQFSKICVYFSFKLFVLYVDRDFQRIDEALLAPVTKALAPIANISVESQVAFTTGSKSLASLLFSRATDLCFLCH